MESTPQTPIEELSFKQANIELEHIVRALESGDLELEEALDRYSRGVKLLADLHKRLENAEQQVQVLLDQDQASVPDTTTAPSTAFINE